MTNQSLKNKKIVISAGASGIGWATTKVCISRGAQNIVFCENYPEATKVLKKNIVDLDCEKKNSNYNRRYF